MKGSKKLKFVTREDWLCAAAEMLEPHFNEAGAKYPKHYRITISLPSGGTRSRKTMGECWDTSVSGDKAREIFISPWLEDPMEILGTLTHELCHACLPEKTGHRKPFADLGRKLHLAGKPKHMGDGPEFIKRIGDPIASALGPFPHAAMKFVGKKKQTTRLIKVWCEECGYTCRVSFKWLSEIGGPLCPEHNIEMQWEKPE